MSFQGYGTDISMIAGADLSNSQFRAVKINASGQVVLAAAGEAAIGFLQNDPASGQPATVRVAGVSKARAGGTITAGADVASNASGQMVTATGGRTNTSDAGVAADPLIGSNVIGIAIESAVTNDVFAVLITHRGAVPTTAA